MLTFFHSRGLSQAVVSFSLVSFFLVATGVKPVASCKILGKDTVVFVLCLEFGRRGARLNLVRFKKKRLLYLLQQWGFARVRLQLGRLSCQKIFRIADILQTARHIEVGEGQFRQKVGCVGLPRVLSVVILEAIT